MRYAAIARTKKDGYLVYEWPLMTVEQLQENISYQAAIKDERYIVRLMPAKENYSTIEEYQYD